jgi:hypothetical protein
MSRNALVPTRPNAITPELGMTMSELGKTMAASGFFQDTKDAAQAIVKILAGQELGFGPVASMTGIYVVKGRVTLSANLIAAAVKRSGRYDYRVRELSAQRCEIEFFEHGESVGSTDFSMEDAKTAGLLVNDTWKKFGRNMLFARTMSNGARFFCADVFGGPVYTAEELGAQVNGETGEILSAPAAPRPLAPVTYAEPDNEPTPEAVPEDGPEPVSLTALAGREEPEAPRDGEFEKPTETQLTTLRKLMERTGEEIDTTGYSKAEVGAQISRLSELAYSRRPAGAGR